MIKELLKETLFFKLTDFEFGKSVTIIKRSDKGCIAFHRRYSSSNLGSDVTQNTINRYVRAVYQRYFSTFDLWRSSHVTSMMLRIFLLMITFIFSYILQRLKGCIDFVKVQIFSHLYIVRQFNLCKKKYYFFRELINKIIIIIIK